jgi:hypothetical protein
VSRTLELAHEGIRHGPRTWIVAPSGVFAHPDETRLHEIVEARDRMLRRSLDATKHGPDWRRGVEFASWTVMGAAMRDLPPLAADYQRAK